MVLFANHEAAVAIERTKAWVPLAPNEINDQTATLEIEDWQLRRPLATGFSHQFVDFPGAGSILIDFTQPLPGPRHVRLYTLPRGTDWVPGDLHHHPAYVRQIQRAFSRIALSVTPSGS